MKTPDFPARFSIRQIITGFFLVLLFVIFTKPVTDPDTLWTLTSGQFILENLEIPRDTDPFSFDSAPVPELGKFILSQSWLGQVIAYSIYSSFGLKGFVVFKALLSTLTILLVWKSMQRLGFLTSLIITGISVFYLFTPYASGRSQNFTFLFAAALIFLLEREFRTGEVRYLYPIPVLMALWSNTHGGFIFGVVVLMLHFTLVAVRSINQKLKTGQTNRGEKNILTIYLVSALASLMNPNGGQAFMVAFSYIPNEFSTTEYYSPLRAIRMYPGSLHYQMYFVFLGLSALSTIVLLWKKKYAPALLTAMAATFSLVAVRYVPLFIIVSLSAAGNLRNINKCRLYNKTSLHMAPVIVLAAIVVVIFKSQPFGNPHLFEISNSPTFPVNAVSFMDANNIQGNVYASYNTSRYVLFSTYPESRIFLDSRVISADRMNIERLISGQSDTVKEYLTALNELLPAELGQDQFTVADYVLPIGPGLAILNDTKWKEELNRIGADIIIHEAVNQFSGKTSTLILKLVADPDWYLVYGDGTALIFLKKVQKFREIIASIALPKDQVFNEILIEANGKISNGETAEFHASIALAMVLQGMLTDRFEQHLNRALELDPINLTANYTRALKNLIDSSSKSGPDAY